jgi:hypothetical protein
MNDRDMFPEIQDGDLIAFQCRKGLGDWLIRWWTKSPWTHVGVACWWRDTLMIVESYPGYGVRCRPLSQDLQDAYWIPTGLSWTPRLHEMATDLFDTPYSWINDWQAAWGEKLLGHHMQCAQYASYIFTQAGLKGMPLSPTPGNVVACFKAQPQKL